MTTLLDLRPPEPEEKQDDTTWDSTFQREIYRQAPPGSATISPHALAVGSRVYGIATSDNQQQDVNSTWTWQQTLTGEGMMGLVNTLTSNSDGTVIVAATDAGVVALMRGSDGQVLATRKVCSDVSGASLINLTWIPCFQGDDVLLIEAPNSDNHESPSKLILVSNIQGGILNQPNLSVVAEAAQKMQIQTISLAACGYSDVTDLLTITGCFTATNTIRLIGVGANGNFAVFDYNLTEKNMSFVQSVLLDTAEGGEWVIDFDAGLVVQMKNEQSFILYSAVNDHCPFLVWFDPVALETACQYALPRNEGACRTKVMAIESLQPVSENNALTVVVAEKNVTQENSSTGAFYVVQILVEEAMGRVVLNKPHLMYKIPAGENIISVALASVPCSSPYSFRYKLWKKGEKECVCKQFQPDKTISCALGAVRAMVCRSDFDGADDMLADVGLSKLEEEPYAGFHSSEIALHRLKDTFTSGHADALANAQVCLRRLAAGTISSNEKGLPLFLQAIDFVINSPSNLALDNFLLGLKAVALTISEVLLSTQNQKLQSKKQEVETHISALEFLSKAQTLLTNADDALSAPFNKLRSPNHLFRALVKDHKFELAEMLYRSNLRDRLVTESIIMPILSLSAEVEPMAYVSLIQHVAIPSLVVNDDMLSRLNAWCCKVADDLDDKNDLDAAILLLETVDKGNRDLQLHIHSSFSSFTPFSGSIECRRLPDNAENSFNTSVSADSADILTVNESNVFGNSATLSKGGNKLPVPTLHEVTFAKRRRLFKGESGAESDVDCVRNKLAAAKCLREARALGLDRKSVLLRDYENNGGAQYVAKSLVRLLSAASSTHESRLQTFCDFLKPFCEQFGISADKAKLECTADLCRGKSVSSRAIEEACSIARGCSSVIVRCDIALAILRAALLCDSALTDVLKLAKESIVWASCDSRRQSELEEAARLIKIDNIVLTYCGPGARELFRVENPRHAIRLLGFVTRHIERETVIDDALSLCEAFHHLSSSEAATTILQNAILHDNCKLSKTLLKKLIEKNCLLAAKGLVGSVLLSQEILEECSKAQTSGCGFERLEHFRNRATQVCMVCGDLLLCAIENDLIIPQHIQAELDCYIHDFSLKTLRDAFLRVERLQNAYGVYISLAELQETKVAVDKTSYFLEDVAACYITGDIPSVSKNLTAAKRVCSLLAYGSRADESELWIAASAFVTIANLNGFRDGELFDFMLVIGLLTTENCNVDLSGRANLAIALSLCFRASSQMHGPQMRDPMKLVAEATALVRDYSLVSTKGNVLTNTVSLAGHLDVSTQVFARGDEGVGELIESFRLALQAQAWTRFFSPDKDARSESDALSIISVPKVTLHPSWYIGDGLLLPPCDSLSRCLMFCKGLLSVGGCTDDDSISLCGFVAGRGAHALAFRVLCIAGAIQASCGKPPDDRNAFYDVKCLFDETTTALAERSLGGTGSGITSSVIDSQQAVVFLLTLPVKQAFAAYKSCIPTAVKTQNFYRLYTLASIGIVAGSGVSKFGGKNAMFSVGWKNQPKFLTQCQQLSAKAKWWAILKDLGVDFDSQRLLDAEVDTTGGAGSSSGRESDYAASLIPLIIRKLSQSRSASEVLRLTSLYAKTFFISRDLVVSRHVECLLTTYPFSNSTFDASKCEKAVRTSLQHLHPLLKRASVLRRCLVELEKTESAGTNYELHSLVLALYQETLASVVDRETPVGQQDISLFEAELELIDKRRDALAIVSSFFVGDRFAQRPPFSSFFRPLRVPFNHAANKSDKSCCDILGRDPSNIDNVFDPLQLLEQVFLASLDTSAVTALAPLCRPLGLPQGYIHARSLKARFHHSSKNNVAQPSFENDVNPVLKRIRSHRERAILAEWCADQYDANDTEKLKCYEIVFQSSMQASTDIEQKRHQFPNDSLLEQEEMLALAMVKKMSSKQNSLSDTLRAKAVLLSADGQSKGAVKAISIALVDKLDCKCRDSFEDLCPESLIDFLYVNGSLLASEACLHDETCLSVAHFRQFCTIVHSACQSVAEQHSHIDHGNLARRHAHRWLFFGDEWGTERCPDTEPVAVASLPSASTPILNIDEEDTIDFVMDLSGIQAAQDGEWSAGVGKGLVQNDSKTRCQEESSVLRDNSSRELSEKNATRSALRIAFVMAFSTEQQVKTDESSAKENSDSNKKSVNRSRPQSIFQTKVDSRKLAVNDLCLELLQIVFAKSGTSSSVLFSRWGSFDATETSKREVPKIITFSMRHRALRAASILCPEEVLEQVASDENFLHSNNGECCSLLQSTFGVFLAKEIEEMGLPLPHSDLVQLSSMNFASYARTLWRYHRDDDVLNRSKGKGRLFLLLIEMTSKSESIDPIFIEQLLDEMIRLNLSRGLLLALEHIVIRCTDSSMHRMLWDPLSKAITAVGRAVLLETKSILSTGITRNGMGNDLDGRFVTHTFERLYTLAVGMCDSNPLPGLEQLLNFARMVSVTCCDTDLNHPLVAEIQRISRVACERATKFTKLPTITITPGAT